MAGWYLSGQQGYFTEILYAVQKYLLMHRKVKTMVSVKDDIHQPMNFYEPGADIATS